MEWSEYQALAMRTANDDLPKAERLENAALGLVGESGEIAYLIKKHVHHGHILNRDTVIEECGDLLWYVGQACSVYPNREIKIRMVVESDTLAQAALELNHWTSCAAHTICLYLQIGTPQPEILFSYLGYALGALAYFLRLLNSSIAEAQEINIAKLRQRYPDGFSSEASINR